jgi:hypothetical protein
VTAVQWAAYHACGVVILLGLVVVAGCLCLLLDHATRERR